MHINILIVDDHQIVRDGIVALLAGESHISVSYEASSGKEAMDILSHKPDIQLVLTDIEMPGMDGAALVRNICNDFPHIKCIALTMHGDRGVAGNMLRAGARGYLLKSCSAEQLVSAINIVMQGGQFVDEEVHKTMLQPAAESSTTTLPSQLTARELEILKHIANGHSNTEIGDILYISARTVDTHRTNLMRKLDVHNIAGLIRFAFKHGLVD
ncbi:MAG: response regulator transcription factor [Bacteroidia bacterium]